FFFFQAEDGIRDFHVTGVQTCALPILGIIKFAHSKTIHMISSIKEHIEKVKAFSTDQLEEVERFRIQYLGKKGVLNDFFAAFKNVPNEQKKEFGQVINELKNAAQDKVTFLKEALENRASSIAQYGDLTRPGMPFEVGSRHPISLVRNQIIDIFSRIGFNVSEGPEIE